MMKSEGAPQNDAYVCKYFEYRSYMYIELHIHLKVILVSYRADKRVE